MGTTNWSAPFFLLPPQPPPHPHPSSLIAPAITGGWEEETEKVQERRDGGGGVGGVYTSGKLTGLICSVFLWMSCLWLASCAPPLLGCVVGMSHLPAHRGAFRSVPQWPYWRINDLGVRTYFVMIKTWHIYERFKWNFWTFNPFHQFTCCFMTVIDFNDAWILRRVKRSVWKKLLLTRILRSETHPKRSFHVWRQHLARGNLFPFFSLAWLPLPLALQILLFQGIFLAISPPGDSPSPDPAASFALLLVKYNIYLSLFEFTHPYHWVCSPWLWGGLV